MSVKLPPLPGKDDEYWEHADVKLHEIKDGKPCKHYFIHRTGQEVMCRDCNLGYWLSAGWRVEDGVLYTPENEPVN